MCFKLTDFGVVKISTNGKKEVIDYGVQMVGAPLEWEETQGGAGIRVGVIDTGAESDHEDLLGAVAENRDFTSACEALPKRPRHTRRGHNSGKAERRRRGRSSSLCSLYVARAFEADGSAKIENVERALEWLISLDVHVINMSFCASRTTKRFAALIRMAYERGICIVSAAGNDGEGANMMGYPARFEECVAVTAVDIKKRRAPFSTAGKKAEVCAAGTDIYSCYKGNAYATLSGTSMATPVITGSIALLQAKARVRYGRRLTPSEIRLLLHMYAENLGDIGRDESYGYGLFTFDRLYYDTVKKAYVTASSRISARRPVCSLF